MHDVILSFDDLDEKQKQRARENFLSNDYPGWDWWDTVYEDAMQMAKILGIEIAFDSRWVGKDKKYKVRNPKIFCSGFWSQGDGASFQGKYAFAPECSADIRCTRSDAELTRIADALTAIQVTRRLQGLSPVTASITTSGMYCHSGTINVEVHDEDDESLEKIEGEITRLMRDFADWIYDQLEKEYDYLTSNECVDEYLAEEEFDEDGNII